MKGSKILGIVSLILAALLVAVSLVGSGMNLGDGKFSSLLAEASARKNEIAIHEKAAGKTAPNAVKKADSALKSAQKAASGAEEALENVRTLSEAIGTGTLDDALLNVICSSSGEILSSMDSLDAAIASLDSETLQSASRRAREAGMDLAEVSSAQILALYEEQVSAARSGVEDAEKALAGAQSTINDVFREAGLDGTALQAPAAQTYEAVTPENAAEQIEKMIARSQEMEQAAAEAAALAEEAQNSAKEVSAKDKLPWKDRLVLLIGEQFIGVMFTAFILIAVGVIALFFSEKFLRAWRKIPVFSTFISALVMIIIQTYSLGFHFATYGEWGAFWLSNMLNVLRSNSSVGMIALGMTFVIITGGIDLAVGSTLAGIATVVMVVLDISSKGFFTGKGIVGVPNYLLAIGAGLLTGVLMGALTGFGITRGRIPPFIFTLGMMNIIRSVAQYFTKSYKPEVPKGFQVIANQEVIGGQMLLPILYWLILAVIMFIIANHTTFGRHIYAVGSNERTSRLSGINVDRVKMKVYILMGLIVAIAAIVSVARLRGVDVASAGSGYEMNAIAAVIVGGTAMAGGRGSIVGTMLGVLIIGIMNNLLVLLHIDAFLSEAFTGAIIIFAVFLQRKDR